MKIRSSIASDSQRKKKTNNSIDTQGKNKYIPSDKTLRSLPKEAFNLFGYLGNDENNYEKDDNDVDSMEESFHVTNSLTSKKKPFKITSRNRKRKEQSFLSFVSKLNSTLKSSSIFRPSRRFFRKYKYLLLVLILTLVSSYKTTTILLDVMSYMKNQEKYYPTIAKQSQELHDENQNMRLKHYHPNEASLQELKAMYEKLYPHISSIPIVHSFSPGKFNETGDVVLGEFWGLPPTSPQHLALSWLVNDEKEKQKNKDNKHDNNMTSLTQRYALATLYFSTNIQYLFLNPQNRELFKNDQSKLFYQKRGYGGDLWGVRDEHIMDSVSSSNSLGDDNENIEAAVSSIGWKNEFNFLSHNLHECEWKNEGGVRSCTEDGEIIDLSLWNNLVGTLPMEIGLLTHLQILYLARNRLYGPLPTTIGLLTNLQYLGLQYNRLSGIVPSQAFRNLRQLQILHLERNDFTGLIRRIDDLCQLKVDAIPPEGYVTPNNNQSGSARGQLREFTADCREVVAWKDPEVTCGCCTECYRF